MDSAAPQPDTLIMTTETPNVPRLFSYTTAAFMLGAVVHMLTSSFLPFTQIPAGIGLGVMAAYAFMYGNLAWSVSKRYFRKTRILTWIPYLLSVLMVVPAAIQVHLQQDFPEPSQAWLYVGIILTGALAGSRLGIHAGLKRSSP
jgi:peptidoglycan/LPS O-acetylase OafA/YrhL